MSIPIAAGATANVGDTVYALDRDPARVTALVVEGVYPHPFFGDATFPSGPPEALAHLFPHLVAAGGRLLMPAEAFASPAAALRDALARDDAAEGYHRRAMHAATDRRDELAMLLASLPS